MSDDRRYKIVRFRAHGANQVVRTELTEYEAQEWCQREDTHGEGWFDGYTVENPTDDELRERAEGEALLRSNIEEIERLVNP